MGIDIIPLAYHHRLDINSDENFSADIAEKFSGNVTLFMEDDELKRHELFKVEKADSKIDISIIKEETPEIAQLLYRVDLIEDALNHYSMEIYPHHVDMYLMDAPFRWGGFENCIRFKEKLDLLKEYRSYIKDLCDTMGCDVCLFIPDQGYTEFLWEETQKGGNYDSVIKYIQERKYLEKSPNDTREREILYLPDYLKKDCYIIGDRDCVLDVVIDDFSDMK